MFPYSAEETVVNPSPRSRQRWLRDQLQFVKAFIKNPTGIGAILPSSDALAIAITAPLTPGAGKVLELGSGTGVFTQQMLAMGFNPADLILVEQDPTLAAGLKTRFPLSTVLQVPAQALSADNTPSLGEIAAIICGLPLRNMSAEAHGQVLAAAFRAMKPDGVLYLFTYGMKCPVSPETLQAHHLVSSLTNFIIKNLPPASIYCISRAQAA